MLTAPRQETIVDRFYSRWFPKSRISLPEGQNLPASVSEYQVIMAIQRLAFSGGKNFVGTFDDGNAYFKMSEKQCDNSADFEIRSEKLSAIQELAMFSRIPVTQVKEYAKKAKKDVLMWTAIGLNGVTEVGFPISLVYGSRGGVHKGNSWTSLDCSIIEEIAQRSKPNLMDLKIDTALEYSRSSSEEMRLANATLARSLNRARVKRLERSYT